MPVEAAAFRTEHTRDFLSQQDCRDNFHYAHHEKNAFTFINISSYLWLPSFNLHNDTTMILLCEFMLAYVK